MYNVSTKHPVAIGLIDILRIDLTLLVDKNQGSDFKLRDALISTRNWNIVPQGYFGK